MPPPATSAPHGSWITSAAPASPWLNGVVVRPSAWKVVSSWPPAV
jgi:hypothetical protein